MELKEKLQDAVKLSDKKHASPKLVYLLGLFGLALVVLGTWLYFSDTLSSRSAEKAAEQGYRALEVLREPVDSF